MATKQSDWLRYLPAIYADHAFVDHLLQMCEAVWHPLDQQLDQMHCYFDPSTTPQEFLPWLATWVDLILDENMPEPRRRALIQNAARLYRQRGTVAGLRDYLFICTGVRPEIIDDAASQPPHHFTVRFGANTESSLDQESIQRIINEEKPAHTSYTLQIEEEQ